MSEWQGLEQMQFVIERIAVLAEGFARQANVGGMETAGGLISYLATHPRDLEPLLNGGIFELPPDWIERGCLTWHAQNGKIIHPEYARRSRVVKSLLKDPPQAERRER